MKVKFSEFLEQIDFDYEILNNKTFRLVDLTGVNFGGLEDVVFDLSDDGIREACDCFDALYSDCFFDKPDSLLEYHLVNDFGIDTDNMTWEEKYNTYVDCLGGKRDFKIECIFEPSLLAFDEEYLKKSISEQEFDK